MTPRSGSSNDPERLQTAITAFRRPQAHNDSADLIYSRFLEKLGATIQALHSCNGFRQTMAGLCVGGFEMQTCKRQLRRSALAAGISSVLAGGAFMAGTAFAQDQQGQAVTDDVIIVTGSRIVRRDFVASSPIVTVGEDLFDQSATAAIETHLNQLPQFTPTSDNPTQGGDIQPNARNTPGEATLSLRGLGANRSIVLINGRRGTPSNAAMVTDINSIPRAAIERVEVITGGASATYGADGVAGAVNFIMRDDFEGVQLDLQVGSHEEGDASEYQLSGLLGADFADGGGNVSVAFSSNKRNEARQVDREWFRELWADPTIGGTQFFAPFTGYSTGFANFPDPAVLNAQIDGANFTAPPVNSVIYSDFDGNAFSGFDVGGVPGISGAEFVDGQRFVTLANGQLGVNNTNNFLIFPLERRNIYSQANYELSDSVGVFAEGYFGRTTANTTQEPVPITGGWSVPIDPTINGGLIPDELLAILDSRPMPDAPFALRGLLPFNRTTNTDVFTYSMTAGVEGDFGGNDWTWEVFTSKGETETTALQEGFVSLQRMRAIMQAPNFGQGFAATSNTGPPDFGFGGNTATCTTGLNPFAWGSVSQDCFDAIIADIATKQVMEQTIWQANFQGGVGNLPAGEVIAAFGVNHRENDYRFENDTLVTQGASFLEQSAGLFPAGNAQGTIEVEEAYFEMLIPVVSDRAWAQRLDLEVGARGSDYNTTGSSNTFKLLTDWRVTDRLRFRGGFNRAERAPNVAELFLAAEQTFAVAGGGDVCSINNPQPWSANPEQNPANWDEVVLLCGELMEATGNPDADVAYYGVDAVTLAAADPVDVAAGNVTTEPQASGFAFLFPTTVGNSALDPEEADTWTFGAVIDFANLQLSVDYYQIEVIDAIGEQSADLVMRQCTDPAFNPGFDIDSPFCQGFNRDAEGFIGDLRRTFFNNGRFETSGVDVQLNWDRPAGPGEFYVNSIVNVLLAMESAELPTDSLVDYKGTLGPDQNGLDGSAYDYQILSTFGYNFDDLGLSLRWHHLPSIEAEIAATIPGTTIQGSPSYNLFDLLGRYQLTDRLGLRFGVENVFNKEPPLNGRNPGAELPSLPEGSFDVNGPAAGRYDTNGRRIYFGATMDF
jgi:outer membrane receptor protein involved in Fe transport